MQSEISHICKPKVYIKDLPFSPVKIKIIVVKNNSNSYRILTKWFSFQFAVNSAVETSVTVL